MVVSLVRKRAHNTQQVLVIEALMSILCINRRRIIVFGTNK
jgi:hypothetical protein